MSFLNGWYSIALVYNKQAPDHINYYSTIEVKPADSYKLFVIP